MASVTGSSGERKPGKRSTEEACKGAAPGPEAGERLEDEEKGRGVVPSGLREPGPNRSPVNAGLFEDLKLSFRNWV